MADNSIRDYFLESINEIFSTLFNEGTYNDGLVLYQYFNEDVNSVYREQKYKRYKPPIYLVCSVSEVPSNGSQDVERQKLKAVFKIPTKAFIDRGIEMSQYMAEYLRKSLIKYKEKLYTVDMITGKVFIENTYAIWQFECTEVSNSPQSLNLVEELEDNITLQGCDINS